MLPKPIMTQPFRLESIDQRIRKRGITLRVWENDKHHRRVSKGIGKDQDMILDNFSTFIAGQFLSAFHGTNTSAVTLTDTGNAGRSINIITQSTDYLWNYPYDNGVRVGVGTGAGAAARTNYNLGTQVGSWTAIGADPLWTSATGKITFAGDVLIAAGATVTEAGIICSWRDTGGTTRTFLLLRDVFAGVVIAAGHYAHCDYEIAC